MADYYKINPLVLIGVPTLEKQPISWEWSDAYASLQIPLGCSHVRQRVENELVGNARNILVQRALDLNCDWVLFISDDVIPPANIYELLSRHKKPMVTGVYWTKSYPHSPYIWKGLQRGPFVDWKYGEFFQVDWAGVDALLVHTDVFKTVPYPWFSHEWTFEEEKGSIPLATEDLYFYTKARKYGFELWCDAACQCLHQDRASKIKYGLSMDMPQHKEYKATAPKQDGKLYIADISVDQQTPYLGDDVVKRFCMEPALSPDMLCDIRSIPEPPETFDSVRVNDALQHYFHWEAQSLLKEWTRVLKTDGTIEITVPDVAWAAREIIKADNGEPYDGNKIMSELYGVSYEKKHGSHDSLKINRCGYTKTGLFSLLSSSGYFGDVVLNEKDGKLVATARKLVSSKAEAIMPKWKQIAEREGIERTDDPYSLATEAISRLAIQKSSELTKLAALLKTKNLETVVEIGTAKGGTLWMFCQIANEDATLISMDMPGGEFGGGYTVGDAEKFKKFLKPGQQLHFIRDNSHDVMSKSRLLEFLGDRKIDFLFIDGDHTYEGVKKDFEMYSELVSDGGLIAFHDILPHPHMPLCRVDVFWNEIKNDFRTHEFIDPIDKNWGGIGVVEYQAVKSVKSNGKHELIEA